AGDLHAHLDAQRRVEITAVIVEKALRRIDAVRNALDDAPHGLVRVVPDCGHTLLHGFAAVAGDEFGVALGADLAGSDLRTQVSQARLRIADIVADDLVARLVEFARLVYLERAHLQPLAEDVGRGVRSEALPSAADIDPVGTVGGEADQLALVEAWRVDDDVVQVLATDMTVIHHQNVAFGKTVEAVFPDPVLHRDAEVGEEDRQATVVLRDHTTFDVDEAAAVVAHLVDHHVVGGLAESLSHLVCVGDDGIADDFYRDRIGLLGGHHSSSGMLGERDHEMARLGHLYLVVRVDQDRGVGLLDDCRSAQPRAGGERRAPVDARL